MMTRAQIAYFKDKSPDERIKHIKDIITDPNYDANLYKSFFILCSDYSSTFDTLSREYI